MSETIVIKKKNNLGIIAVMLSVFAFLGAIFIVPAYLFGVPAIILAVLSIVDKNKKTLGIISISLSIIAIVFSTVMIGLVLNESKTLSPESSSIRDFLSGYSWTMGDGSLLTLNDDGSFFWWQDPDVKDDYYYSGYYEVLNGDAAIKKIDSIMPFDETLFERQTAVTRNDVFCLTINNVVQMIDGTDQNKDKAPFTTTLYIAFPNGQTEEAGGMNTLTFNRISMKKTEQ